MRIAVADESGTGARSLSHSLVAAGHSVRSLVAHRDHTDDVRAAGADVVVADLGDTTATRLTEALGDTDAVVFVTGGAYTALVVDAAQLGGILRFVLVCDDTAARRTAHESALEVTVIAAGDPDEIAHAVRRALVLPGPRPGG